MVLGYGWCLLLHRCRIPIDWATFCSLTNNWALLWPLKSSSAKEVPERAEYIRVILAELTRVRGPAASIGFLMQEMGASGICSRPTPEEKVEALSQSFESVKGRVTTISIGGLNMILAGIKVTDTRLVRDAIDLARSSWAYLFNHVMRFPGYFKFLCFRKRQTFGRPN